MAYAYTPVWKSQHLPRLCKQQGRKGCLETSQRGSAWIVVANRTRLLLNKKTENGYLCQPSWGSDSMNTRRTCHIAAVSENLTTSIKCLHPSRLNKVLFDYIKIAGVRGARKEYWMWQVNHQKRTPCRHLVHDVQKLQRAKSDVSWPVLCNYTVLERFWPSRRSVPYLYRTGRC